MIDSFPIRKQNHFDVREQAVLFLIVLCELSSRLSTLQAEVLREQCTPQQAQHICCCQYGDE